MLGAIIGGAQVLGGISGFMSGRKEKKWGRRKAARAQAKADARLENMDAAIAGVQGERERAEGLLAEDQQRYQDLGYDQITQDLSDQVREGVDVEGRANTAADEFTNQFDVSQEAQRRAMLARGVRPGSAAMASLGEDAAYDRARGAATEANTARRSADDENFARRVAFSDRGAQVRNNILNQSGNIASQYRGEFGMQGQIRGQYLGERTQQQARAEAGRAAMTTGAAAVGQGAVGMAGAGAFGSRAKGMVDDYVRTKAEI